MEKKFNNLKEFYPFYLSEHQNKTSRILHFIGTTCFFVLILAAIISSTYWLLFFVPIVGYGFAWIGHFFYEKNKPATFQYPFYSLASDFILYFDLILGKEKFETTQKQK
jgi:hypothetical protein